MTIIQFGIIGFIFGFCLQLVAVFTDRRPRGGPLSLETWVWGILCGAIGLGIGFLWNL